MTKVIPIATTPTIADCRPTFSRLLDWKNEGSITARATMNTAARVTTTQFERMDCTSGSVNLPLFEPLSIMAPYLRPRNA